MEKKVKIKNGVFYINQKAEFFLTGEYPYYRDKVSLWDKKLKSIKNLGINIITSYVPWRHHYIAENGIIDFNGKTASNRDIIKFLQLCMKNKLFVFIKPGPFIHAETTYGGLIDEINPSANEKIESMLDINGKAKKWFGEKVPSPANKDYQQIVRKWFQNFKKFVLDRFSYPEGPIIAVQIANEGIYSDSGGSIDSYDFSKSSMDDFYKTYKIKNIKKWSYPDNIKQINIYYKWSDYQSLYLYNYYCLLMKSLNSTLPYILNLNGFHYKDRGVDGWFSRNNIEKWKGLYYGYTNWVGVVAYDESAYYRYLILIKRSQGFNIEENWGFSKIYDSRFYYPNIPYFQTLLIMAGGSKGFNVYTVVGTNHWDKHIQDQNTDPYPASPPITHDNKKGNKYKTLKLIVDFIKKNKKGLLFCEPVIDINYAFYTGDFYLSAWDKKGKKEYWKNAGIDYPFDAGRKILDFIVFLRKNCFDFNLVNLKESSMNKKDKKLPFFFICSGILDERTENKIIQFVKAGGTFLLAGQLPFKDIENNKLHKIKQLINKKKNWIVKLHNNTAIVTHEQKGKLVYYPVNPLKSNEFLNTIFKKDMEILFKMLNIKKTLRYDKTCEAFMHFNRTSKDYFIYVFNKVSNSNYCNININHTYLKGWIKILLVSRGACIINVKNKKIKDVLYKKENEYEKVQVSSIKIKVNFF